MDSVIIKHMKYLIFSFYCYDRLRMLLLTDKKQKKAQTELETRSGSELNQSRMCGQNRAFGSDPVVFIFVHVFLSLH